MFFPSWPIWVDKMPGVHNKSCFVCDKRLSKEEIEENRQRYENCNKIRLFLFKWPFWKWGNPWIWGMMGKRQRINYLRRLKISEGIALCSQCRKEVEKKKNS